MVHPKGPQRVTRRVWRVTQNAPQGEYVDPDAQPAEIAPAAPAERAEPGFLVSSFELTHGLEVSEETDTLPGDLFDELFNKNGK